jgi:hypothetical protein
VTALLPAGESEMRVEQTSKSIAKWLPVESDAVGPKCTQVPDVLRFPLKNSPPKYGGRGLSFSLRFNEGACLRPNDDHIVPRPTGPGIAGRPTRAHINESHNESVFDCL